MNNCSFPHERGSWYLCVHNVQSKGQIWKSCRSKLDCSKYCKSRSGTERSTFWSVSAHQHQIEDLQKAFLNALIALSRARYFLGSRTRNIKLYHFKDKNCTIYLWIWAYSQTWDRTVHLRTAAGHLPGTSVSDDHRSVKVLPKGHGNYERTKDLGCIKGCNKDLCFPNWSCNHLRASAPSDEVAQQ